MKKSILWAAFLLLLTSCQRGPSQAEFDSIKTERDSLSNHLAEMQELILTVNSSLDSISMQEGRLFIDNADGTKATRNQMLDRLSEYKDLVDRQKEQLSALERQQDSNKASIKDLKAIIARLRQDLQEREFYIAKLEKELDSRKRDISGLQKTIEEAQATNAAISGERDALQQVSAAQDELINTGYYVIASKSELKSLGLIKGTFHSKADYANIDNSKFTKIDIRKFTEVKIKGRSPKLLTEKPAKSYTLTDNGDGTTTLRITYPALFWQSSSYLIIQCK